MNANSNESLALRRRGLPHATLLIALTLLLGASGALQRIDLVLYDELLPLNRPAPSPELALVLVDEPSLKQIGRWPWPRAVHARLVDRLRESGARAVALQFIF